MESFRYQDMHAEKSLGKFMDAYFYNRLKTYAGGIVKYTRMLDKESQLKGIDVCLEADDKKFVIDEKASFYYSNAMIPTFAFEIDSIQKGHSMPVQGWFINDELETQLYMLIWPNVKCESKDKVWIRKSIGNLTKDDFTIIEAMLIYKSEIRREVAKLGYSKEQLTEIATKIRSEERGSNDTKRFDLTNDIKIVYSGQLPEKPINLVISKNILRELAEKIYLIAPDGYATIKGD